MVDRYLIANMANAPMLQRAVQNRQFIGNLQSTRTGKFPWDKKYSPWRPLF
jgi:hypothetical protein